MADFVPSVPHEAINVQNNGDRRDGPNIKNKYDQRYMACFYFILNLFLIYVDTKTKMQTYRFSFRNKPIRSYKGCNLFTKLSKANFMAPCHKASVIHVFLFRM